jgi:hypothetical protein
LAGDSGHVSNLNNAVAWGLALWFWMLQWGMTHRAWQARLLWSRGRKFTAGANLAAVGVCAWFVHAALLQALSVAENNHLLHGFDPEMLAVAMILIPLLEPLGFWTVALLAEPVVQREEAKPEPEQVKAAPVRVRRPVLRLVHNGALAAMIAQMAFIPRDWDGFERAVMVAQESPNLSQHEIAARAGVKKQTLAGWMNRAPEVFRKIAA